MKTLTISKVERFIIYPSLIALFVLLAFFDLPIMESLYNHDSIWARIFEFIGEQPFQFFTVFGGVLMFKYRPKDVLWKNILFAALGVLLAVFFALYAGSQMFSYIKELGLGEKYWLLFLVASIYVAGAFTLAYMIKDIDGRKAFAFGVSVILLYTFIWVAMNAFKVLWQRPRWRYLVTTDDPLGGYRNVWEPSPGWPFRSFFASFPSGHTMNAAGGLVVAYFFKDKMSGKSYLLLRVFVYLWTLLTALSRIVVGAHFASDVTMGFLLGFFLYDMTFTFLLPALEKAVNKTSKMA